MLQAVDQQSGHGALQAHHAPAGCFEQAHRGVHRGRFGRFDRRDFDDGVYVRGHEVMDAEKALGVFERLRQRLQVEPEVLEASTGAPA